ncbi:MAG: YigZ family protein [Bacteroidetes bacterium]|nr:YigZ family protein [Bacteroidota bacterium]
MNDLYHTISSDSEGQFKDRGSRFIALVFPVVSEDEIREKMAHLRKEYHDARHHSFAWRLGADMERYRINDDGEPSGSAGRPIFGQIQKWDLTDILVVVVRYFGGTLLGVGGLISAYRSATAEALERANIIEKRVEQQIELQFPYEAMNGVMKLIKEFDLAFENQHFDLTCTLKLRVWSRHIPAVTLRLSKLEGCKIITDE